MRVFFCRLSLVNVQIRGSFSLHLECLHYEAILLEGLPVFHFSKVISKDVEALRVHYLVEYPYPKLDEFNR